jgi:exonuclease SbcC
MVEMMGRQGGRIESLFLDEGFGALDRTNLDAAVEALASVAAKGRMVGVVTHLRAVAEQIDNVLSVTREPAGSEAVWLADNDRADLAASSIETASGLLE